MQLTLANHMSQDDHADAGDHHASVLPQMPAMSIGSCCIHLRLRHAFPDLALLIAAAPMCPCLPHQVFRLAMHCTS